ncbi:MAG: efflux RND transporter periplasmic adaptor subunit [Pirellulaceae bacterium]|jgi:membrane fusion protein, multidrug efflux system|nr:efflux RND transporter periplasmic adaptor subunit [Pirellulaceae bacterium]
MQQKILVILRTFSKLIVAAVCLALLAVTIAWMGGYFNDKIEPDRRDRKTEIADGQETDTIHEVIKPVIEEAVGTLRAASRTVISSRLMATVAEISVVAGQEVQQNDVLIRLDAAEYDRRLEQARQSLAAAQSTLEFSETEFQRAQRLLPQNAISQAEFDALSNRLLVAQAEQLRAKQMVAEAEVMLSYREIAAPKAGRIVDRFAELGDLVQPGSPLISMYDASSLRLETPITEQLATRLRVGQTLTAHIDAVKRDVTATIREIVPQADAASRSFLVKAAIEPAPDLYEGMFGRLRIDGGERRHLCLNTDALIRIGQLEYVDVQLPNGQIERRLVRTGTLGMPGRVEVLSGVQVGETIILRRGASNEVGGSNSTRGDAR